MVIAKSKNTGILIVNISKYYYDKNVCDIGQTGLHASGYTNVYPHIPLNASRLVYLAYTPPTSHGLYNI